LRSWFTLLFCVAALLAAPPRTQRQSVRIPVWTDSAGPLRSDDLVAKVDGATARVVRLQGPADDLMLLVVLDMVADLNDIELAREALISTIAGLPPNVYIGLLRAQDGLQVLLDPTADHAAAAEAIRTFAVSGTPGLLETIETASDLADSILAKAPVRIALCYITDSSIYEYREDFTNPVINYSDRGDMSRRFPEGLVRDRISKLDAKLSSRQTPVFVVHLQYETRGLNQAYQNGLMQLTSTTGGSSVFCRTNIEITTAIEDTFRTITSHYGLDLQMPAGSSDSVEITLESGNATLNYRGRFRIRKE
jgi:hypothetical protein